MRRSTSRIGKLPRGVLEQVNEKLSASWGYGEIRRWLFELVAEEDVPALGLLKGEKFGEVWLRSAKSAGNAGHFCELALGNWFRSHHGAWVREKILRGETMRVVKRAAVLTRAVGGQDSGTGGLTGGNRENGEGTGEEEDEISVEGGDVLMRSVLIDAVETVQGGSKDPKDIAQLAGAWARLNQGRMEEEKLKLKTESKLKMAFDELGKDLRGDPEARELFDKLYAVAKRLDEEKSKKMARN